MNEDSPGVRLSRAWLEARLTEHARSNPSPALIAALEDRMDPSRVEVWLNTPRPELNDRTPRHHMIANGEARIWDILRNHASLPNAG